VKAVVEIDKRVGWPDFRAKFFTSHEIAGTLQQRCKHLEGLALQTQLYPPFPQLAGAGIKLKNIEAQHGFGWGRGRHNEFRKLGQPITVSNPWRQPEWAENVFVFMVIPMEETLGIDRAGED
jgi:hypothetical protein